MKDQLKFDLCHSDDIYAHYLSNNYSSFASVCGSYRCIAFDFDSLALDDCNNFLINMEIGLLVLEHEKRI